MIPFSPPRVDQKTIDAVVDALQSGWITTGPKTKLFEKELSGYVGAKSTFCCNSNTNGMELMLRWLGVGVGDEVIVPAYTYCATANVVVHLGATPIMVDVLEDFTINPAAVKAAITSRTKAILPVDLGGLPARYDELWEVVRAAKPMFNPRGDVQSKLGRIALISDAAHSIGARYDGDMLGGQADALVFSFHAVKNLTTAEGGAVCMNWPEGFDNDEIYRWLNTRSLHGQSKDALAKTQIGAWEYDVLEAGWKCNMTDIQAAIGLVELERYESETLPKRKDIVQSYQSAFANKEWAITPVVEDMKRETSYHLYLLRIKGVSLEQRNQIIDKIFAGGVSVNVHYKPLPLLTVYSEKGYKLSDYPVTKNLWETEISLPVYYDLEAEKVRKVIDVVCSSVESIIG